MQLLINIHNSVGVGTLYIQTASTNREKGPGGFSYSYFGESVSFTSAFDTSDTPPSFPLKKKRKKK